MNFSLTANKKKRRRFSFMGCTKKRETINGLTFKDVDDRSIMVLIMKVIQ